MHALRLVGLASIALALTLDCARAETPCFASCRQIHVGLENQQEGWGPRAIARADLDGDGRDDLAVPCRPMRVEIVWNSVHGLAQTTQVLALPVEPVGLEAADFDGDGDVDLLVVAQASFTPGLLLLRNLGGRQFGPPETVATQGGGYVEVGDVNVDGAVDIVIAFAQGPSLKILWNSGTGTFPTQSTVTTGTPSAGFALGDLDGDSRIDLVLAPYNPGTSGNPASIRVQKNLGGTFAAPHDYPAGLRPWMVALGDVDNDGDLDVIVLDANGSSTNGTIPGLLHVFVNDGAANLVETAVWSTDPSPWAVAVGDIDGDFQPEIAVTCEYGNHLSVSHNLGGGSFANPVVTGAPEYAEALSMIDADRDGRLDLAVASSYNNTIGFLHNEGAAGLRAGEGFASSPSPSFVTFADVTGDGIDEAITLDRNAHLFSVQSLQSGGLSAPVSYPVGPLPNVFRPSDMALFDADLDGDLDAVVVEASSLKLFFNAGNGTFGTRVPYATSGHPTAVAVGDFDQDGDVDIAFDQEAPHQTGLLVNQGNGTFALGPVIFAGPNMGSLCAGDFDGDGRTDLVLVSDGNAYVVAFNLGANQFQLSAAGTNGAQSRRVRSADLDGDGDLDLVFASAWFEGISVVLNNGDRTFAPYVAYEVDPIVDDMAVADLDHDGDPDIVFKYLNRLEIMTNDGHGVFTRQDMLGTNTSAVSIAVTDFDADGDADIAWVDGRTPEILLQRGCASNAQLLCIGDGSGAACPCGNASRVSSASGCLNSLSVGGTLRSNGDARLWNDRAVLLGSDMPNASSVLYLSATSIANGGSGVVFGDGLRCAAGVVTRLSVRMNVGGRSQFPTAGDPPLSTRSGVTSPGTRYYQAWYRDVASFCSSQSFNLTNAVAITWRP